MANKKTAALKIKKKSWFKIFAPKSFRDQIIGETLTDSVDKLIGKTVKVNLSVITGDMKKQGTILKFKVTNVRPEGGNTEVSGYELIPAALKRHMRRGVKTIANSFECTTADGVRIRIKPIVFTRNQAKGMISKLLNKTTKFSLLKTVKSKKYEELFLNIVAGKLQRELKEKLNQIFPVRMLEIKALIKLDGEGKTEETTEEKEENKEEDNEEAEGQEEEQQETEEGNEEEPEETEE